MSRWRLAFFTLCMVIGTNLASAQDWVSARSTYSHDPMNARRVNQYTPVGPVYVYTDPTFLRSGYRQTRSRIRVGNSFDNYHVVEEWGRPVRPYGEWQFPFRPYSVPYAAWGAPYAGMYQPIPYLYPPFGPGYPGIPGVPHPGFGPGPVGPPAYPGVPGPPLPR